MTKAPVPATIELWVGDNSPGNKGTTCYGTYFTNPDGSFDVKSNTQWNGNQYHLYIKAGNSVGQVLEYQLNYNKNKDIGDILTGSYTFLCKVTIHPVSGSAIDFPYAGPNATNIHFNAGTITTFMTTYLWPYDSYIMSGKRFPINYKTYPGGVAKDTNIFVPITSPDTLRVTINY
ncbi:MAG TPA: hypothetical protein VF411_10890 [Bacteroidia bacterium]